MSDATTAQGLAPGRALGACVRRAGDLPAGLLLFAIASALHTVVPRRGAEGWVARSRTEWMDELALSLDQLKRALRLLRSVGLVDSRQRSLRGPKSGRVLCVRLSDECEAWARAEGLVAPEVVTRFDPRQMQDPEIGEAIHQYGERIEARERRGRVHRARERQP